MQVQRQRLEAANCLLASVRLNSLISHMEAELGMSPSSEDLELEEDDG